MKEFELDRQVDAIGLSTQSSGGIHPNALYVPVAVVPVVVYAVAALYVAAATINYVELALAVHQGAAVAYASAMYTC